jgi:cold shock CspA family protein
VVDSVLSPSIHLGRVTAFDAQRGWGTVTTIDGADLDFHATAIADGTRSIGVGTEVAFRTVPGHRGRYEAGSIIGR